MKNKKRTHEMTDDELLRELFEGMTQAEIDSWTKGGNK